MPTRAGDVPIGIALTSVPPVTTIGPAGRDFIILHSASRMLGSRIADCQGESRLEEQREIAFLERSDEADGAGQKP